MSALHRIEDIVCQVQALDLAPSEGINRISAVLESDTATAAPAPMTARAWLGLCLLVLVVGLLAGWSARVNTTKDRYINSLAERHEATARFYEERTDQLVNTNPNPAKGAQHVKR